MTRGRISNLHPETDRPTRRSRCRHAGSRQHPRTTPLNERVQIPYAHLAVDTQSAQNRCNIPDYRHGRLRGSARRLKSRDPPFSRKSQKETNPVLSFRPSLALLLDFSAPCVQIPNRNFIRKFLFSRDGPKSTHHSNHPRRQSPITIVVDLSPAAKAGGGTFGKASMVRFP